MKNLLPLWMLNTSVSFIAGINSGFEAPIALIFTASARRQTDRWEFLKASGALTLLLLNC